ncbi:MAG: outer membrane beta-barrel protein [Candidatus Marinimicrobia bacterium]|nr:outer membrane beta-barrel protein [Candidatus Neomarinimicrobiota bacterium]
MKQILSAVVVAGLCLSSAMAIEGTPFKITSRLRLEYDDNIRQAPDTAENPKEDSLKYLADFELWLEMNGPHTYFGLRYRPSIIYWDNRPEDDLDVHHDFDLIVNHQFSPRVSLNFKDTFRRAELPELIERGDIVRERNDFNYNSANVTVATLVAPALRLDLSGRHELLRYDDSDVASSEDYDKLTGGATLRQQLNQASAVAGDLRYAATDYDTAEDAINRDTQSVRVGGTLEHIFSPVLMGQVSAGFENKSFDADDTDDESSPYVDASLSYFPQPDLRLNGGASYSFYDSGAFPYANQTRTMVYGALTYDLTERLAWNTSLSWQNGHYKAEDIPGDARIRDLPPAVRQGVPEWALDLPASELIDTEIGDADQQVLSFSTRMTFRIHRSHWLELGWNYNDVDTDIGTDYKRNRISIGWKAQL